LRAVNANVLVRALVRDDAAQSARAEALLDEHEVFVPVTVVLELDRVLRSRYGFAPRLVALALEKIAALGNVVTEVMS
jgi:predicted nucleic-acid-binding protein